jgi:hypothetical protein
MHNRFDEHDSAVWFAHGVVVSGTDMFADATMVGWHRGYRRTIAV